MSGPTRLDTRGSHRYNVLPQFRPDKRPDYEQELPAFSTRLFKRLSDFFLWGKEIITNKDYRPDAGYVEAAWRLVERGHQLAGTSLELPTVAVPGEYENVLEQPALAPEQPTDTALEPIMEDVPQPEFELVEQPAPRYCPAHPFYNFLAIRPRLVPAELQIPPYELLPPAPEFLPPFADYPQDEFEYWLQWRYPAITLSHQLRAIGRMTAYTEAYLGNRGDGAVDIMEFKGIMREVQDQPDPEWIRQERLADYEAIRAARKAARSIPPRVETPEFLALRAAALAEIEWFKNATANTKALMLDAATIHKDCFPAASAVATQNDSAPDTSAVATHNDAAPTSLPDPSQPLPDASPIVSVHEVSSPPERSPSNPPPSPEMPLYSTMAFIEIVNEVTKPVEEPDVNNPYNWEGARTHDVDDSASLPPLKRTWQQMKDLEVGAKQSQPRLTEQRIIEATVPKGAKRSRPDPNTKFLNPAANSGQKSRRSTRRRLDDSDDGEDADDEGSQPKKRRITSMPNGHSDSSPSPEVADVDMDDAPSTPITKPMEVVEPPPRPSTPASPPVSTPTPTPVPRPAVTPLAPSPVINSSHVDRLFTRNSYAPREPSKLRTSFTFDQDSEEETDSCQEHDSTMVHAPVPKLVESIPSQEYPALAHALAPSASMVPISAEEHPANAHAPAKAHLVCQEHPLTPVHAPATLARDAVTSCASTSGQQREQETVLNSKALECAASVPLEALPRYKFSVCSAPSPGAGSRFTKAWQFASSVPVHTLPTYNFVKHAAPSLSTSNVALDKQPEWICGLCQLRSPDSAVKCITCDAPRQNGSSPPPASSSSSSAPSAPSSPPPVSGFNWAAAGLAPPSATSEWECSTCMVRNQSSAQQCIACESAAPSALSPPPPVSGFNWAAAGLVPPSATSEWECSICMVRNQSSMQQCIACEAPKP